MTDTSGTGEFRGFSMEYPAEFVIVDEHISIPISSLKEIRVSQSGQTESLRRILYMIYRALEKAKELEVDHLTYTSLGNLSSVYNFGYTKEGLMESIAYIESLIRDSERQMKREKKYYLAVQINYLFKKLFEEFYLFLVSKQERSNTLKNIIGRGLDFRVFILRESEKNAR